MKYNDNVSLVLCSLAVSMIGIDISSLPTCDAAQPAAMPDWLVEFHDPPATYRPQMFWVWNGELTHERTTEVMEQYAGRGIGGVFVHPRPGLITEYLSPEYFEQWKWTLSECKRLGMECHIYDENGFPSGFASGEVIAANPGLAARYLTLVEVTDPEQIADEEIVACFVRTGQKLPRQISEDNLTSAAKDHPVWALVVRQVEAKPQHGSRPYPDMLRAETTEIFLRVTHDRYAELFQKDFGGAIKYVFTDEPTMVGANGYPWSDDLLGEFQREHGYDLRDKLGVLCFGGQDETAVRFDYFQTVGRLWIDNCFKPIYRWCERHNVQFTGHLWEHEWPLPQKQPLVMHTYRWMQAPGTDLLGFHYHPTKFREQAPAYLNQKELSSIGNQLGRERLLCESSGAGGYEMALREFKPLEDFLLAAGVNVMTPHLSYQTLAGARKYDWPQTISDHSSWWDSYRLQADHVGRVAYTLARGCERNRVLVLHPCTTGWMRYQHKDFVLDDASEANPVEKVGMAQQRFLADLHAGQIDFDLGDELTMAELGDVGAGRLRVGKAIYDAVVVPPAMENWTTETLERIGEYLEAGGVVFSRNRSPLFVDGRPSDRPAGLVAKFAEQWKTFPTNEQLVAKLRKTLPPRITCPDGSALPAGLCWRRHERPDGAIIYFLSHPWEELFREEVRLEGRSLVSLDTVTGEARYVRSRPVVQGQVAELNLPPSGHRLLIAFPEERPQAQETELVQRRPVELETIRAERMKKNILPLMFCDLTAGDTTVEGVNTTLADEMNWNAHGHRGNIWSHSAQFRRDLINASFPEDSGFTVGYHFHVDARALESLQSSLELAVERPWLYEVTLNDKHVSYRDAERWLDPDIRKASISAAVRGGTNTIVLKAQPMRALCEIMPAYVLGDFAVQSKENAFQLVNPKRLELGPWTEQGLPFYCEKVVYRYRFSLDERSRESHIRLPKWSGSAARVLIDGDDCGVIAWQPDHLHIGRELSAGNHELQIVVAGNMKNLMGPHFSDGLPGIWSWRWSGQKTQPPEKYNLAPCGLMEPPVMAIAR